MGEIKKQNLPPNVDCESVAILKELNKASRALEQLKGEVSKIGNLICTTNHGFLCTFQQHLQIFVEYCARYRYMPKV